MSRIHRCKVVGLSHSRATKSSFHWEKTEHIGMVTVTCLVSSFQHEQDVQYEFSKGSEHCSFFCAIVTKKLPYRLVLKNQ